MRYWRCFIQLAIPEDVYNALPSSKKIAARDAIRDLKALSRKINEGQPNEEMTVTATWHLCDHESDNPTPCVEHEI